MHEIWTDGNKLNDSAPIGTVVEDDDGDVTVLKGEGRWVGEGATPREDFNQFGPWRVLRWGFSID